MAISSAEIHTHRLGKRLQGLADEETEVSTAIDATWAELSESVLDLGAYSGKGELLRLDPMSFDLTACLTSQTHYVPNQLRPTPLRPQPITSYPSTSYPITSQPITSYPSTS